MRKYLVALILIGVVVVIGTLYTAFGTSTYTNIQSQIKPQNGEELKVDFLNPPNTPLVFKEDSATGEYYTVVKLKANKLLNSLPVSIPKLGFYNITVLNVTKDGEWYVYTVKISAPEKYIDKLDGSNVLVGTGSNYTTFEIRTVRFTHEFTPASFPGAEPPESPIGNIYVSQFICEPVRVGGLTFYDSPYRPLTFISGVPVKPTINPTWANTISGSPLFIYESPMVSNPDVDETLRSLNIDASVSQTYLYSPRTPIMNATSYIKSGIFEYFPVSVYYGENYTIVTVGDEIYKVYSMSGVPDATETRSKAFLEAINVASLYGYRSIMVYLALFNVTLSFDSLELNGMNIYVATPYRIIIQAGNVTIKNSAVFSQPYVLSVRSDRLSVLNSYVESLEVEDSNVAIEKSYIDNLAVYDTNSLKGRGSILAPASTPANVIIKNSSINSLQMYEYGNLNVENSEIYRVRISVYNATFYGSYIVDLSVQSSPVVVVNTTIERLSYTLYADADSDLYAYQSEPLTCRFTNSKVYGASISVEGFVSEPKTLMVVNSTNSFLNIENYHTPTQVYTTPTVKWVSGSVSSQLVSVVAVNSTVNVPDNLQDGLKAVDSTVYVNYKLFSGASAQSVVSGASAQSFERIFLKPDETMTLEGAQNKVYYVTFNNGSRLFVYGAINVSLILNVAGYKGSELSIEGSTKVSITLPTNWSISDEDINTLFNLPTMINETTSSNLSFTVNITGSIATINYGLPLNSRLTPFYTIVINSSRVNFNTVAIDVSKYYRFGGLLENVYADSSGLTFKPDKVIGSTYDMKSLSLTNIYAISSRVYYSGFDEPLFAVVGSRVYLDLEPLEKLGLYDHVSFCCINGSRVYGISQEPYDDVYIYADPVQPGLPGVTSGTIADSGIYGVNFVGIGANSNRNIVVDDSLIGYSKLYIRVGGLEVHDTTLNSVLVGNESCFFFASGDIGDYYLEPADEGYPFLGSSDLKVWDFTYSPSETLEVCNSTLKIYGVGGSVVRLDNLWHSNVLVYSGGVKNLSKNGYFVYVDYIYNGNLKVIADTLLNGTVLHVDSYITDSNVSVLVNNYELYNKPVALDFKDTDIINSTIEVQIISLTDSKLDKLVDLTDMGVENSTLSVRVDGGNVTWSPYSSVFYVDTLTDVMNSTLNARISLPDVPDFGVYWNSNISVYLKYKDVIKDISDLNDTLIYITFDTASSHMPTLAYLSNVVARNSGIYGKYIGEDGSTVSLSYGGFFFNSTVINPPENVTFGVSLASRSNFRVALPPGTGNVNTILDKGVATSVTYVSGSPDRVEPISVPEAVRVVSVIPEAPLTEHELTIRDITLSANTGQSTELYVFNYELIEKFLSGVSFDKFYDVMSNLTRSLKDWNVTGLVKVYKTINPSSRRFVSPAPFPGRQSQPEPLTYSFVLPAHIGSSIKVMYVFTGENEGRYPVSDTSSPTTVGWSAQPVSQPTVSSGGEGEPIIVVSPLIKAIEPSTEYNAIPVLEYYGLITKETPRVLSDFGVRNKRVLSNTKVVYVPFTPEGAVFPK